MPSIEEVIDEQRRRLLARESRVLSSITRSWEAAAAEVSRRAELIAGEGLSPSLRQARLAVLSVQIEEEIARASSQSLTLIERERRDVVIMAAEDWKDQAGAIDVSAGLDQTAAERIQAAINAPSPLSQLLASVNVEGAAAARQALFVGVALGDNPSRIGSRLREALGTSRARAQTIARTEVLRAYRGAIRERMKQAQGVVGWVWISARDRRTCAMCWAMHGTKHRLDEVMGTHPNCRCSQAPLPAQSFVNIGTGVDDFAQLSRGAQLTILGPSKFNAYQDGRLDLPDLVATVQSPAWGLTRYEKSLEDVVGVEAARAYRRRG